MWHTRIATRVYVTPMMYEEAARLLTSEERPIVVVDGPREGPQFYRVITDRDTTVVRMADVSAIRAWMAAPGTSPEANEALDGAESEGFPWIDENR